MALFNMSQPQQPGMNMPGMQTPDMQPINYQPQMPAPQQAPQANPFAYQHQKPSVMGIIADGLSGAAGQPGRYGEMLSQQGQTQRELAMQSMHIQQIQAAEYAKGVALHDHEVANPTPDSFQKTYAYLKANNPAQAEVYLNAYSRQGGGLFGTQYTDPGSGAIMGNSGPPPAGPVGALTDQQPGGPTPPASGTFR